MSGGVLIYVCIQFEVESMLRWKLDDEESILKTQSTVEELIGFVKEVHNITNDLKLGNPGLVFQVLQHHPHIPTHTHTYLVSPHPHILCLASRTHTLSLPSGYPPPPPPYISHAHTLNR